MHYLFSALFLLCVNDILDLQDICSRKWIDHDLHNLFIQPGFQLRVELFLMKIFPSEARPKAELRSPEAELFSSLGNWVGKKKVDKKKRYDDDGTHVFCPPLFPLQILRKCQFLKKISEFWNTPFIFWEREKFVEEFGQISFSF